MGEIVEQASGVFMDGLGLLVLLLGVRVAGVALMWIVRNSWVRASPTIEE